ncbi:hypothetical protein DRF60_01750 [Chryseobacterium elymi]|uniref:Uncharacterized protein n=1 Tax=Chryseobacterium elymi TaxID=395936 RepID=A0A3D9DR33_9FLAO|nr:hypothetical protein [Chryseobacterium elymi]REC80459.1 hypothetical protein DRF60_01750 [Chryseobacterium elymi]
MKKKSDFEKISIRGRYIYGYLCLKKYMRDKGFQPLPNTLEKDIEEFVISGELDTWHENVEEVPPSIILNNDFNSEYYEIIDFNYYNELREYYLSLNQECLTLIDNLIPIGIGNLYGQFKSELTLDYLENIIEIMNYNKLELPKSDYIANLTVDQKNGWGNRVNMKDYIS